MSASEVVTTRIGAKILGVPVRTFQRLCEQGEFKTAYKPGTGPNAHIRVQRAEVLARKLNTSMALPKL